MQIPFCAQFDVALLTMSLLVMLWFKTYYHDKTQLVDYDENLTGGSFLYIILGVIGSLTIATFLYSNFTQSTKLISSIWVPTTRLGLSVGQITVPHFWNDVLFTLTLVAPAEESCKLISSLGIYTQFKEVLGKTVAKIVAIVAPIGAWALLHTIQNPAYQGQYAMVSLATAFLAGLLMYYVMQKTHSLLACILVHASYNCILLYITYYGLGLA